MIKVHFAYSNSMPQLIELQETLAPMGLPIGLPRPRATLVISGAEAKRVLEGLTTSDEPLEPILREPPLAWLFAFRQHWRSRWDRELGAAGERCIEILREQPHDVGRVLKLRRVATENLSALL